MKLILPYFILILFLLQHNIEKKFKKKRKINNETFWKREAEANSVTEKRYFRTGLHPDSGYTDLSGYAG